MRIMGCNEFPARAFSRILSLAAGNDEIVKSGLSHTENIDLAFVHQFPDPGTYKIRVALRSSKKLAGLSHIYYSNWQTLVVTRDKAE